MIETFVSIVFIYFNFYFYRMGMTFVRILYGKISLIKYRILFGLAVLSQVFLFASIAVCQIYPMFMYFYELDCD
jgi:hypothetical protein